jgi:hypothetical protein
MDGKETRAFAQRLMEEVWEPFDSEAVSSFTTQTWSVGTDAPTVLGKSSVTARRQPPSLGQRN